jgi:hypothetical protein
MPGIILQIIKQIFGEEQVRVIAQALPVFIVAVLAGALLFSTLIALALRWRWRGVVGHKDARIEALEEHVRLRDDQLSNKLQTTPPEEARQMIDALQAQIARLTPRRVPEAVRPVILDTLRRPLDTTRAIALSWDAPTPDAEILARDFNTLFREAGWDVGESREFDSGLPAGITLTVTDPASSCDRAAKNALEWAGLPFNVVSDSSNRFPHIQIGPREE